MVSALSPTRLKNLNQERVVGVFTNRAEVQRCGLFARLDDTGQALLRSQGGPGAGLALTACPLCRVTSIEPQLFRVLLLRHLHLPLPLTARHCRCGLPLDSRDHHRAACARVGVLGRRGCPLENVVAPICQEAGGVPWSRGTECSRRSAIGGGCWWVASLWRRPARSGHHHCQHTPRRVHVDGVALATARQRKERRCPELVGRRGRARLVVLAVEVCGRWSQETQRFLSSPARAKAPSVPPLLRKRVEQAWRLRWGSLFSCTVARAVASSLLELPGAWGADGACPASHEVERENRHAGLDPWLTVCAWFWRDVTGWFCLSQKKMVRTTMKAVRSVMSIVHCALHDSVNQWKLNACCSFGLLLDTFQIHVCATNFHHVGIFDCVDGFKMDVLARTTMKAAAKCDKHRELHDSVKVERILFFWVILEIMFVLCVCCVLCVVCVVHVVLCVVCGCVCSCVCCVWLCVVVCVCVLVCSCVGVCVFVVRLICHCHCH